MKIDQSEADNKVSAWREFTTALRSVFCPSRLLFLLVIMALFFYQLARAEDGAQDSTRVITSGNTVKESVLYYTLRNLTGEQTIDEYYGDLRDRPHTGLCDVHISPTGFEEITSRLPFYVSDTSKELMTLKEFPEGKLWQAFEQAARDSESNKVVLFVHGYNIDFVKGCNRAALFQQTLDGNSRLLLFSWPSDGTLVSYTRDEADIEWSQAYLEPVIDRLSRIYGPDNINVVAHSLGSRGVFRVLQLLSRTDDKKLINELVFLAPDIDAAVFRSAFPDLKKIAKRITLYSSENDQPLRLSNELHGNPRLGEAGENLVLIKGLDTVDVSVSGNREVTGHLYHLYNEQVRADLGVLLSDGVEIFKRPGMRKAEKDGLPYGILMPASD